MQVLNIWIWMINQRSALSTTGYHNRRENSVQLWWKLFSKLLFKPKEVGFNIFQTYQPNPLVLDTSLSHASDLHTSLPSCLALARVQGPPPWCPLPTRYLCVLVGGSHSLRSLVYHHCLYSVSSGCCPKGCWRNTNLLGASDLKESTGKEGGRVTWTLISIDRSFDKAL